jgi:ribosomal protein L11 methyltransferase
VLVADSLGLPSPPHLEALVRAGAFAPMTAFSKLSIYIPASLAAACADGIAAWDDPTPLAVTSFEDPSSGGWMVDAYFDESIVAADLQPYLSELPEILGCSTPPRTQFAYVPDEDWTAKVQRDLAPVRAGRFIVHGAHDRARVRPARWAIEIEAGEAFGTAHHATTRGCLEAIDRLALRRTFREIADIGCGTGVLAIAAAMAWPRARVMASDNDPIATAIAAANARFNRVGARVRTATDAGLAHPALRSRQPYDLILANILAAPLVQLAPAFTRALEPGGVLVISGLLTVQTREVLGAYRSQGLRCQARLARGEWMTLVLS